MSLVILQPCGNRDAREHYNDTIKNTVDLGSIRSYLSQEDYDELESIYQDGKLKIWG